MRDSLRPFFFRRGPQPDERDCLSPQRRKDQDYDDPAEAADRLASRRARCRDDCSREVEALLDMCEIEAVLGQIRFALALVPDKLHT